MHQKWSCESYFSKNSWGACMPPDPPSLGVFKHTLIGPLWGPTNIESLDTPLLRYTWYCYYGIPVLHH
jgi:hypothetical protein